MLYILMGNAPKKKKDRKEKLTNKREFNFYLLLFGQIFQFLSFGFSDSLWIAFLSFNIII